MNGNYIELSTFDVTLAAGFIIIAGLISVGFKLGLVKQLLVGTVRTAAQLGLAGIALTTVFNLNRFWVVMLLVMFMTAMAFREAINRQKVKLPGARLDILISMFTASFFVSTMVTGVVIGADPWWKPSVFIPLLGMILGYSLNGVSITLDRFLSGIINDRARVEMRLTLGGAPNEAVQPLVREAIGAGMIPMLNAMAIVGVVTLPGMMTGQLLAGADPKDAVMYQIVVMYMLTAAAAISSSVSVLMVRRRCFNEDMSLKTILR